MNKSKKYIKLLLFCLTIYIFISFAGSKYIIESKFPLDRKGIKEIEKLTSEVFKFTNHNRGRLYHIGLFGGIPLIPFIRLDNKLTSYAFFFNQSIYNYLKIDGYLCGGHSNYLYRILQYYGVKSFVYNHGNNEEGASHVVVIAEINNKLYLFDPTYNAVYKDNEQYLSFDDLLSITTNGKDLRKYISIINPGDKVYDIKSQNYKNYNSNDMIEFFNKYKKFGKKKHILLSKIGMYFSSESSRNYFFAKYKYLDQL